MKKFNLIIISFVMMFYSLPMLGWGPMGHDVVAAIAEQNLSKKAKKALDEILDGRSIVYYSSWMDNIQNSPQWKGGYDKTKTWHYANVDKGHTYETMPKNEKGDILTALDMLTLEMTENYDNLSDSLKADYVKMIVHLVGDMHCPMHAGRLSDRGGNGMKVKWFGQKTSLHSVWDSKIVESARRWSYQEWADQLDRKDKKFKKAAVQGTYLEWFTETVNGAAELYDYVERIGKDEPNLSYQYIYDFSPLLEDRLLIGGYRLAHVLNTIFD
jgi:hypothetical protein